MSDRPYKSIVVALVLWLLLGGVAAHRFYLGRAGTALMFILFHAGGWALVITAQMQANENMLWMGLLLLAACAAWLLVDLFFIPGMVGASNDRLDQHDSPFMPGTGSMDPSFRATMRKAGMDDAMDDPDAPQKSSLPDDYVLPWRQEDTRGKAKKYRPGEDE